MITDLIELPPVERMERLVGYAFGGLHHVYKLKRNVEGNGYEWWRFSIFDDISTHDSDKLTRLVVASLEYGVRVSVVQGGPHRLGVILHPRKMREGSFHERIDTPEKAIKNFNREAKLKWVNENTPEAKP